MCLLIPFGSIVVNSKDGQVTPLDTTTHHEETFLPSRIRWQIELKSVNAGTTEPSRLESSHEIGITYI